MKFTHIIETPHIRSFRTDAIAGMFDVPVEDKLRKEWEVDLPIEELDWHVGLIVGPSGAGKTTIARRAFPNARYFDGSRCFDWTPKRPFIEDFDKNLTVKDITTALYQVGFSSPPAFLLPFENLSNGQKFRTEMARLLLESLEIAVVDEFTSVVDRQVAKVCSAAVQKMIRRQKRKLVAVSCHFDIIDWLEPDWVYYVHTGEFRRGSLRRPQIRLTLQRVHRAAWRLFRGHHYLSADISPSATCFLATIESEPVAFCAALPFPHPKIKNMWKEHRTVVLPDYQGIGIGNLVSETVAQYFIDQGKRYTSTTSHPAMIHHRMKSDKWIMTRRPSQVPQTGKTGKIPSSAGRMTASFEYIAPKSPVSLQFLDHSQPAYARRAHLVDQAEQTRSQTSNTKTKSKRAVTRNEQNAL
jgi:energy-coupling factor transporter ATP-binding protein EcfA2